MNELSNCAVCSAPLTEQAWATKDGIFCLVCFTLAMIAKASRGMDSEAVN